MKRVLTAIADPPLAQQVELLLLRMDAAVAAARSPTEAEMRLWKGDYDLIIVELPAGAAGADEAFKVLRLAKGLWPAAATMAIAAAGSADAMERAQELRVSHYFEAPLPAPFVREALLELGFKARDGA